MILKIKIPTHLGVYKLNKKARFRMALNMVRRRRNLYDEVGITIDKIILIDGGNELIGVNHASPMQMVFPI